MEFDPSKGIPKMEHEFKFQGSLTVPSAVHGYSIAIEYMKNWFLSKFHEDYFKNVYINGKHILDDYRRFSIFSNIKRENPTVAITPTINMEYDRDRLDSYMGNKDLLIRSFNFREAFFADRGKHLYLGFNVREIEMNFQFRVRVNTKAIQLDLYRYMELAFRIGYTQKEWISVDFHIPHEMIINLAHVAGFEISDRGTIKNVNGFLAYLNAHSKFPIVYKLRTINGQCEYFFRCNKVLAWVSTQDKLQASDGEMNGKLMTNYEIEMNTVLHMMVPHFFVYYSCIENIKYIPYQDSNVFGLFSFKIFSPPETNDRGWNKFMITEYELDNDEIDKKSIDIDISELFNPDLTNIIKDHIKRGISPSTFIDFHLYNYKENAQMKLSWETMKVTVPNPKVKSLHIAIYLDYLYYNSQIAASKQIKESRLS